tara:strand:- start:610 stop:822 length:213 start_codon:yes stop_codon:yes gene_type:complete
MFFKVIDDFLHKTYFKEMQQSLESDEFPWYFNKNITYNNEEADNVFQDLVLHIGLFMKKMVLQTHNYHIL